MYSLENERIKPKLIDAFLRHGYVVGTTWIRVQYSCICVGKILKQSAKTNMNVEEVFFSIAKDIKQRLAETDSKSEVWVFQISVVL